MGRVGEGRGKGEERGEGERKVKEGGREREDVRRDEKDEHS